MEEKRENSPLSRPFTSATALTQMGVSHVPDRYILPPSQRANPAINLSPSITLRTVDLSFLENPSLRSQVIDDVRMACKELGFFQVINHGIPPSLINDTLDAATEFFNLPSEEKMHLVSDNVREPIRYGTSMNHVKDKVHFWRDFIKHYSHPVSTWIDQWPSNPPSYKEKIGNYAKAVFLLQKQLTEIVFEGLGLCSDYLQDDVEEGCQVMAVNYYPACPEPELALGMPPHSDYGTLTILLQNHPGLQIVGSDKNWHPVPLTEGALIVQLGDQMEVMSNGRYKGVVHRATVNMEKDRLSIASLHSMALEKKVEPAQELVDEQHPSSYKGGSFGGFLDYISDTDVAKLRKYVDTLKKNP